MKKTANRLTMLTIAALGLTLGAQAKTFKIVGDRLEMRNLATVESVTDFETFTGRTTKVSGTVEFDPAKRMGSGTITVDLASLDTGIPLRNEHMRDEGWLNTARFPTAKFVTKTVRHKSGETYTVTGDFTMRGVTKPITTDVQVRYRPASAETRGAGFDGNVILVSTTFNVRLTDYGIKVPSQAAGKVANTVKISVRAYAVAP